MKAKVIVVQGSDGSSELLQDYLASQGESRRYSSLRRRVLATRGADSRDRVIIISDKDPLLSATGNRKFYNVVTRDGAMTVEYSSEPASETGIRICKDFWIDAGGKRRKFGEWTLS